MFSKLRLIFFLLTFLVFTSSGVALSLHAAQPDTVAQIDTYLSGLTDDNQFSGSVLVAHQSDILLSKGYNFANREWNTLNAPDTKFRIGSMTKQFTAMSILLLQEQGKLSVEDHVCQYIDNCPPTWADILIRHLLSHTSGLHDFVSLPDYRSTQTLPTTPNKILERFIQLPLLFLPGNRWSYSNSNYIVLGIIIQKVSKNSYPIFLEKNLFEPLELVDTGYDFNGVVNARRAEGYSAPSLKAQYLDMSVPYAAGGLYSTVEDLYKWEQALFGGKVVSEASWDAMLAAAVPVSRNSKDGSYAYGLWVRSFGDHPSIGHNGAINGFTSSINHLTDEDFTVIVLSNFEQVNAASIAEQIVKIYFGES